jgi:H+/Cl- antiporter ClcA
VVLVARLFLPGDGGVSPLIGLQGEKPSPISHAPGIALAALGTLSFGAVLGPEMPLIALGMIVGLLVTTAWQEAFVVVQDVMLQGAAAGAE